MFGNHFQIRAGRCRGVRTVVVRHVDPRNRTLYYGETVELGGDTDTLGAMAGSTSPGEKKGKQYIFLRSIGESGKLLPEPVVMKRPKCYPSVILMRPHKPLTLKSLLPNSPALPPKMYHSPFLSVPTKSAPTRPFNASRGRMKESGDQSPHSKRRKRGAVHFSPQHRRIRQTVAGASCDEAA